MPDGSSPVNWVATIICESRRAVLGFRAGTPTHTRWTSRWTFSIARLPCPRYRSSPFSCFRQAPKKVFIASTSDGDRVFAAATFSTRHRNSLISKMRSMDVTLALGVRLETVSPRPEMPTLCVQLCEVNALASVTTAASCRIWSFAHFFTAAPFFPPKSCHRYMSDGSSRWLIRAPVFVACRIALSSAFRSLSASVE
jgi:hypothetical protein